MSTPNIMPLRNDLPWYFFQTTLSGAIFNIEMRYNIRMNRWIMNILDQNQNPIILGLVCLIQRNMFGQYVTLSLPDGTIFCTDDTQQDTQPTQYSFGLDHTCWYIDKST